MSDPKVDSLAFAPSHFIPKAGLTSIEFPGPVTSLQSAESVVHQDELDKCFNQGGKWLEMKLRPKQHYSIPVRGSTLPVQRLLLKVTRRKRRTSTDSGGLFVSSIVGPVNTTVRFRALADYQYTPDSEGPTANLVEAMRHLDYDALLSHSFPPPSESFNNAETAAAGSAPRSHVEILPPPLSSVKVLPFPYTFKSSSTSRIELVPDEVNGGFRRRLVLRQKHAGAAMLQLPHIHFKKDVPSQPDKASSSKNILNANLVHRIEKILEGRPVWTRQALLNQLNEDERQIFSANKAYLPTVAYTFADGPFRSLIVRFGYDPTQKVDARQYQRVSFTNATATQAARKQVGGESDEGYQPGDTAWDSNQKRRAELGQRGPLMPLKSHIFNGKELHRARAEYQWCDVTDPLIQELVSRADLSDVCDTTHGWFKASQHQCLKAILRLKFRQLEQDLPAPDSLCDDLVEEFNGRGMQPVATRLLENDSEHSSADGEGASNYIPVDKTLGQTREKPATSSRYRSALMPEQRMVNVVLIRNSYKQAIRLMKEVKRSRATKDM